VGDRHKVINFVSLPVLIAPESQLFVEVFGEHVFNIGTSGLRYRWEHSIVLPYILLRVDPTCDDGCSAFDDLDIVNVVKTILNRTKRTWGRHVKPLVLAAFAVVSTHWGNKDISGIPPRRPRFTKMT
jgi:hypothetical protein